MKSSRGKFWGLGLTILTVTAIIFLVTAFLPVQASAVMTGFLDAHGVCHFRDIPEKKLAALFNNRTVAVAHGNLRRDGHGYAAYIREAAAQYRVDPLLIRSVIEVESNFDPNAVSKRGAIGLMQIMPATARDLHLSDPFDPEENIITGTRYLKRQLESFGDIRLGLAAYNAGPGLVTPQGMLEYIPEIQDYVARVLSVYRRLAKLSTQKEKRH